MHPEKLKFSMYTKALMKRSHIYKLIYVCNFDGTKLKKYGTWDFNVVKEFEIIKSCNVEKLNMSDKKYSPKNMKNPQKINSIYDVNREVTSVY